MSGSRSRKVREIFEELLDLPADRRAPFIEQACDGDAEVRDEVLSLLQAHGESGDFMDPSSVRNALGEIVTRDDDPLVGRTIGRYLILGLINRGGMGAVYLAEQDRPRRRVAVKLIDRVFASADLLRRLELEAEVLGRLHHPSIAQILEAGSTPADGGERPYFAMELVDGLPLDEYANSHQLSIRDRLVLMIQICDAIQHAHQCRVIHRDLKPANILVAGDGVPKVLDFGVARVNDPDLRPDEVQTVDGTVMGTVPYMSPEQLRGKPQKVDTRSDIYSLGVIAYELLTGRLPKDLTKLSVVEAARVAAETRASPLEVQGKWFPPDLKIIVAKALEEDPDRRYGSASEFANDLRRFLDHQPIAARPSSGFYHVRKMMSRHKLATALLAALILVLAIFGVLMGEQARRIAVQRDRAEIEARTAREVAGYLQDLFVAPDPWAAVGTDLSARDLLDRGRKKIDRELATQPVLRGRLMVILGRTYHGLGDHEIAGDLLKEAAELTRGSAEDDPASRIESLRALSWWQRDQGDHVGAIATARQALVASESNYGPNSTEVATDLAYLGAVLRDSGKHPEAGPLLERSAEIREEVLGPDHLDLAWSLFHLGWLRHLEERDGEADALYRRACDIMNATLGPENPSFAICLGDWAKVLASMGQLEAAQQGLERSLAIREAVFPEGHPETANCRTDLGYLLWRMGKISAAGEQYEAALRVRRRLFGAAHAATLASMTNVALVHERQGRPNEAERLCRERLELAREHHGPDSLNALNALYSLSALQVRLGKIEEAKAGHRELVRRMPIDNGDVRRACGVRYSLVSLLSGAADAEEALELVREIETALESRPDLDYPPRAGIAYHAGRALLESGHDAEAERRLQDALELQLAANGEADTRVAESSWLLGLCRWRQGDREAGLAAMRHAYDIFKRLQGVDGPDSRLLRAVLLAGQGREDEAVRTLEASLADGLSSEKARITLRLHPMRRESEFVRLEALVSNRS